MRTRLTTSIVWLIVLAILAIVLAIVTASLYRSRPMEPQTRPKQPSPQLQPADANKPSIQAPEQTPTPSVLVSSLAGTWYTADADDLRKQIAGFFDKAQTPPKNDLIALILPHAGYAYSGQTAVNGLKAAAKQYQRIVVIGPSHQVPMDEMLSVPQVTHYQTPLGLIPLDVQFIEQLRRHSIFQSVPHADQYEHSVQIQLPPIQHVQTEFKLVPIVAGQCSPATIRKAAAILTSLIDQQTLVIASSDFTHYGPNYDYVPFKTDVPEQIKKLDMGAYERIAAVDAEGFVKYIEQTGATVCGRVPVAILLSMLDPAAKAELIDYSTSGQLTGNFANSVSYLAVAFTGKWPSQSQTIAPDADPPLSEHDKKQLLKLARSTIEYYLREKQVPQPSQLGVEVSPAMMPPRAAFVTLKKISDLRGCIGDIFPRQPLYRSVLTNALNAAFADRRFLAVKQDEMTSLTIEISVLTPPAPVASYDRIRIGVDGIVLQKDQRSAVFLPQVAPEQGWDLSQTLSHLSTKAGLPPDAWKQGASFLVFQADVFGEEK